VANGTLFHLPGAALGNSGAIVETYALAAREPTLVELTEIVRGADALHAQVAFRGVPMREAVTPDLPPETPGL